MIATLTALRVIHILSGIVWVGGTVMSLLYLAPTAKALGPEGQRFMVHLARDSRLATHMLVAATLAVLSGLWLFWIVSGGMQTEWMATRTGATLTAGAVAALAAYVIGLFYNRPAGLELARLGQEIHAGGGKPTEAQRARLEMLQAKLQRGGPLVLILLAIATGAMAAFRYLGA